jgi:hypothetical protein
VELHFYFPQYSFLLPDRRPTICNKCPDRPCRIAVLMHNAYDRGFDSSHNLCAWLDTLLLGARHEQ